MKRVLERLTDLPTSDRLSLGWTSRTLRVAGELDATSVDAFRRGLRYAAQRASSVGVDMSAVTRMEECALHTLIRRSLDSEIVVLRPSRAVRERLERHGLDRYLRIVRER